MQDNLRCLQNTRLENKPSLSHFNFSVWAGTALKLPTPHPARNPRTRTRSNVNKNLWPQKYATKHAHKMIMTIMLCQDRNTKQQRRSINTCAVLNAHTHTLMHACSHKHVFIDTNCFSAENSSTPLRHFHLPSAMGVAAPVASPFYFFIKAIIKYS